MPNSCWRCATAYWFKRNAIELEAFGEDEIALVHPDRRSGARNLVDYLGLRQSDIRDLQKGLYGCGLTSLGAIQENVMASMNSLIRVLDQLCGSDSGSADSPCTRR